MNYEELEDRIRVWAATQPAVRAVICGGSRARTDNPADRWSDLDIMILTTDRAHYAGDSEWLREFDDLWLAYAEPTLPGDFEWYAIYEGGLKLDAVLLQVENAALPLEKLLLLYPYQGVFARGLRVLFDGITSSYQIPPKDDRVPLTPLPTAAEFDHVVSGFLMAAATTAKFIMRGDLWRAQSWFAQDLRPHLLTMIRWHAYGEGKDLWYGARFIEQWADPRIVAQLGNAFPDYDADSLKTALIDLFDLFGWVSEETAVRFRFSYSITGHRKIEALIEQIFAEET